MKRTRWVIYKPDEKEIDYLVKEEKEFKSHPTNNNPSGIIATTAEDDEGFTLRYISREFFFNEQQEQQEQLAQRESSDGRVRHYVKPSVFERLSNQQIESKIDRFFKDQSHVDAFASSNSSSSKKADNKNNNKNNNNVWTSFKQQPIRLTRRSKGVVVKLYPTVEEMAAARKLEDANKSDQQSASDTLSFKRINASFSSSLRNHRRKVADQIGNKRKRNDSDDSDSEDDARFASCVVSFDDLTKGANSK